MGQGLCLFSYHAFPHGLSSFPWFNIGFFYSLTNIFMDYLLMEELARVLTSKGSHIKW